MFSGRTVTGPAPVPLHRHAACGEGALRRQLQAEGEGAPLRDVAGRVSGRCRGGRQGPGHVLRHRLAHHQRRRHLQVSLLSVLELVDRVSPPPALQSRVL